MKKRFGLLILAMSLALLSLLPAPAAFATPDGPYHLELYRPFGAEDNLPANGESTVRMYVMAYTPVCDGVYSNKETCADGKKPNRVYNAGGKQVHFYVSDSSVKLQGPLQTAADGSYYGTLATMDSSLDFKVTASTPGAKTVTATLGAESDLPPSPSTPRQTVTFAALHSEDTNTPTGSVSDQSGSTTTVHVAGTPAVPTLDTLTIDDKKIDLQTATNITIKQGKSFTLKGVTIPHGTVNLYIHSKVTQASTVANDKGEWQYTVNNLAAGDHYVEAEVFDAASQKISARQTLLSFTVSKDATSVVTSTKKNTTTDSHKKRSWMPYLIGGAGLLILIIIGVIVWRQRRSRPGASTPPANTDEGESTDSDITPSDGGDVDQEKPTPKNDDDTTTSSSGDDTKPTE